MHSIIVKHMQLVFGFECSMAIQIGMETTVGWSIIWGWIYDMYLSSSFFTGQFEYTASLKVLCFSVCLTECRFCVCRGTSLMTQLSPLFACHGLTPLAPLPVIHRLVWCRQCVEFCLIVVVQLSVKLLLFWHIPVGNSLKKKKDKRKRSLCKVAQMCIANVC